MVGRSLACSGHLCTTTTTTSSPPPTLLLWCKGMSDRPAKNEEGHHQKRGEGTDRLLLAAADIAEDDAVSAVEATGPTPAVERA